MNLQLFDLSRPQVLVSCLNFSSIKTKSFGQLFEIPGIKNNAVGQLLKNPRLDAKNFGQLFELSKTQGQNHSAVV